MCVFEPLTIARRSLQMAAREWHKFAIIQFASHARLAALRVGARLASTQQLAHGDDLMHCDFSQLVQRGNDLAALRTLVAHNRAQFERDRLRRQGLLFVVVDAGRL